MAILVVGSVAFDSIETPSGKVDHCLGGAATHFALAASFFTDVRVIGVVGEDFNAEHEAVLTRRNIDTRGIEHVKGKSFHWSGSYLKSLSEAQTLNTELNVFATFSPKIPEAYRDSEYLFLANIDPVLQLRIRSQMTHARLAFGDTMNYWINGHGDNLSRILSELDGLLINDGEARLLAGEDNLVHAARRIHEMGPKVLVIKHGEYGATVFLGSGAKVTEVRRPHPFRAPAMPLAQVVDPTGAGDSFAGGFYGYIASQKELTAAVLKRAMFYGGVMGSFSVEDFGTARLQSLTREEIDERFGIFEELSHLE